MGKKWTKKEIKLLLKLKNVKRPTLQRYFPNKTLSAIYHMRHKLGITRITKKAHIWRKAEIEFVNKNYPSMGTVGCSKKLNISRGQILGFACRNGIKVNQSVYGSAAELYHQSNRKKRDEEAQSIAITTPRQSYTLGFLWGDGHLHKADPTKGRYYAKIEIVKKDYDKVGKLFRCFGKWSEKTRQRRIGKATTYATCFDGIFGAFLKLNKYDQKSKISPSKILASMPNDLHEYFWRGFIDSDGCFGFNNGQGYFQITGDHNQDWYDFEKLLMRLGIKYTLKRILYYNGNTSRISVYYRDGIIALGRFIYKNHLNILLPRKYKKFLSIINRWR